MPKEGGARRRGNTSPGESRDRGVGGNYSGVLEVRWLFHHLAQDSNAEGQRSKAVDYLLYVFSMYNNMHLIYINIYCCYQAVRSLTLAVCNGNSSRFKPTASVLLQETLLSKTFIVINTNETLYLASCVMSEITPTDYCIMPGWDLVLNCGVLRLRAQHCILCNHVSHPADSKARSKHAEGQDFYQSN